MLRKIYHFRSLINCEDIHHCFDNLSGRRFRDGGHHRTQCG